MRQKSTTPEESYQDNRIVDSEVISDKDGLILEDARNLYDSHLLEDILMNLETGIIVVGKEKKLLYANMCAEEMLGMPLVGCKDHFVTPLLDSPIGKLLHQCLDFGISQQHVEIVGASGTLSVSTRVLSPSAEDSVVALASIKDVSEHMELESRLKISNSHEIKNPLASICGAAELLQEESKRKKLNTSMVSLISRETIRLSDTIDHFLDFAREKPLEVESFHIDELLEDVIAAMKVHNYFHKALSIRFIKKKRILIQGDKALLTQVFTNLVLNAMQAIKGSGEITISCSLTRLRNAACITVADTGIGLDPESLKTIFEPFVSSRSTGMGLGLPIAKKILHNHRGSIKAASKEGEGALFEVILPLPEE